MGDFGQLTATLIVGVLLDWLGSAFNSFGNVLMRKYTLETSENDVNRFSCICGMTIAKWWLLAVTCFAAGAISDTISLAMIPLSIWACNTAISIPLSALTARIVLGEKMNRMQYVSILIITIGSVGSVLTGTHERNIDVVDKLQQTFTDMGGLLLASIVAGIEVAGIYFTNKRIREINSDQLPHERLSLSLSSATIVGITPPLVGISYEGIDPPRLNSIFEDRPSGDENKEDDVSIYDGLPDWPYIPQIQEQLQQHQKVFYLVFCGLTASLQTCWTSLLMKCTTQIFGNIARGRPIPVVFWLVLPALTISAALQLTFIQWMVKCFKAVIIVPVYQCLLIILTSVFGVVFFKNFQSQPSVSSVTFYWSALGS